MEDIKKMSIHNFRELGYLRELNRRLLHRLGLALEVCYLDKDIYKNKITIDDFNDSLKVMKDKVKESDDFTQYEKDILSELLTISKDGVIFGRVWDYRDDPEGMIFAKIDDKAVKQGKDIELELAEKDRARRKEFGFNVQPLMYHKIDENGNISL